MWLSPLNLFFKLNRRDELVRTQKRITIKGYHVNFLPAAHQSHPPCVKPPARQSPSSPACPLPSAHRPLVRRLSQAHPSAACAGSDRIVRQAEGRRILLVDGKGKQGSHNTHSHRTYHGRALRPPRVCSCVRGERRESSIGDYKAQTRSKRTYLGVPRGRTTIHPSSASGLPDPSHRLKVALIEIS